MKSNLFIVALVLFTTQLSAQFKLKVTLSEDGLYSIIAKPTIDLPASVIGSGQLTLTVPTGGFVVDELTSVTAKWSLQSLTAPLQAPELDYLFFGLSGNGDLSSGTVVAGREIVLLTFRNGGTCTGAVELIKDDDTRLEAANINPRLDFKVLVLSDLSTYNVEGVYAQGNADCNGDIFSNLDSVFVEPEIISSNPGSAKLSWNAVETASFYKVQVRFKGHDTWIKSLKVMSPHSYFYAPKGSVYEYQITAYLADGRVIDSPIFEISTIPSLE